MTNKIKFIGTGGAFDFNLTNSSAIIEISEKKVLIDCGHSVFPKLMTKKLGDKIDAIILTHLHDDHVGSLSTLLFFNKLVLGRTLELWLPEKFIKNVEEFLTIPMQRPREFAEFVPLENNNEIEFIDTYGQHVPEFQTWAYYFKTHKILYSGDLGNADFLFEQIKIRNLNPEIIFCDVSFYDVPAHIFYKNLEKYSEKFNIFGYHNNHFIKPEDCKIPLVGENKDFLL